MLRLNFRNPSRRLGVPAGAEQVTTVLTVAAPAPAPVTAPTPAAAAPAPVTAPTPAAAAPAPVPAPAAAVAPTASDASLAAPETSPGPAPVRPDLQERGRIRRRVRYLRRLREVQLRDIGGLAVELHRRDRPRSDLVQAKVAEASRTTDELAALEGALTDALPLRELRVAGVGGACLGCSAIYGSGDRYCAACGRPVGAPSEPMEVSR